MNEKEFERGMRAAFLIVKRLIDESKSMDDLLALMASALRAIDAVIEEAERVNND